MADQDWEVALRALEALYGRSSSPSELQAASAWLEAFRSRPSAWTFADQMVRRADLGEEVQYFGANTLRSKIQRDYSQLPPDAHQPLQQSLLALLQQFGYGLPPIRTQLCLALADLALLQEEWSDPLQDIVQLFHGRGRDDGGEGGGAGAGASGGHAAGEGPGRSGSGGGGGLGGLGGGSSNRSQTGGDPGKAGASGASGAPGAPGKGADPSGTLVLMELLTLLPEQARDDRIVVDKKRRNYFCNYLGSHSEQFLAIMVEYARGAGNDPNLLTRILRCILAWLQSRLLSIDAFAASPFFDLSFQAVHWPHLADMAVDVIIGVVDLTGQAVHYGELIDRLVPAILEFAPMYQQAVAADDVDQARALNRIFVSTAEAYLDLIGKEPGFFAPLLDLLLLCTQHVDLDLAQMNFYFWHRLAHKIDNFREDVGNAFQPYYLRLIEIIVGHLPYEATDTDESTWTATRRDDFSRFRHDIGDILKDCCDAISSQACLQKVLDIVRVLLQQNSHWVYVEAALFAVRAMSSVVVVVDNVPVLREVMELILSTDLPRHPKIRYTITNILGQYATWSRSHPDFVERQIVFVLAGFDDPEVAPASALALKRMAERCDGLMTGILDQLVVFHSGGMAMLRAEDQLEITDALACIVRYLPPTTLPAYLQSMSQPILEGLRVLAFSPATASLKEVKAPLMHLHDRLTIIFKRLLLKPQPSPSNSSVNLLGLVQPNPALVRSLSAIIEFVWPIWEQIFERFCAVGSVVDRVCRCVRYAVAACRTAFVPIFDAVVHEMLKGFALYRYPPYLMCARELVKNLYGVPTVQDGIQRLLTGLSQTTVALATSVGPGGFMVVAEVMDTYFEFAEVYVEHCPLMLLGHPAVPHDPGVLPTLIQFATAALRHLEGDAVDPAIRFVRALLESLSEDTPAAYKATMSGLLTAYGLDIVKSLLHGVVDTYSMRETSDVADTVYLLLKNKPAETSEWLVAATEALPTVVLPSERQRFLHEVLDANSGSRDSVSYSFRELGRLCRQRADPLERSRSPSQPAE